MVERIQVCFPFIHFLNIGRVSIICPTLCSVPGENLALDEVHKMKSFQSRIITQVRGSCLRPPRLLLLVGAIVYKPILSDLLNFQEKLQKQDFYVKNLLIFKYRLEF